MTENTYFGFARCANKKCGFGFGFVSETDRQNCQEKKIVCPLCGNKLEVME